MIRIEAVVWSWSPQSLLTKSHPVKIHSCLFKINTVFQYKTWISLKKLLIPVSFWTETQTFPFSYRDEIIDTSSMSDWQKFIIIITSHQYYDSAFYKWYEKHYFHEYIRLTSKLDLNYMKQYTPFKDLNTLFNIFDIPYLTITCFVTRNFNMIPSTSKNPVIKKLDLKKILLSLQQNSYGSHTCVIQSYWTHHLALSPIYQKPLIKISTCKSCNANN